MGIGVPSCRANTCSNRCAGAGAITFAIRNTNNAAPVNDNPPVADDEEVYSFTVTNTANARPGSLRRAILDADSGSFPATMVQNSELEHQVVILEILMQYGFMVLVLMSVQTETGKMFKAYYTLISLI